MGPERHIDPSERRETREYSIEDISNLYFWSFYASQGLPDVQYDLFDVMVLEHPKLVPALMKFRNELGSDQKRWPEHPTVKALLNRLARFRNSKSHSPGQGDLEDGGESEDSVRAIGIDELSHFLRRADPRRQEDETLEEWRKDCYNAFASGTISQEEGLWKKSQGSKELATKRKKIAWSMLCRYGLSRNRERYLSGASGQDPVQPIEFQEIWRKTGDHVRATFGHYEEFMHLAELFEQETGEHLGLSS